MTKHWGLLEIRASLQLAEIIWNIILNKIPTWKESYVNECRKKSAFLETITIDRTLYMIKPEKKHMKSKTNLPEVITEEE
jgi:hypothetical protein